MKILFYIGLVVAYLILWAIGISFTVVVIYLTVKWLFT